LSAAVAWAQSLGLLRLSPSHMGESMINVIRLVITVVFGFLWWWIYNRVGASLDYLMILGSVLAVCVCCCRGGEQQREWSWDVYIACIRRCWVATLVLMVALFIIGILVVLVLTGAPPGGVVLTDILLAAIGAPLFVRLICCAYE
jgi:membrane protease YdiL (CAAX protease family)